MSTRPVLQFRKEVAWEALYAADKITDDLAAHVVRLGAGMSTPGPDPRAGGGCYLFVANGSLDLGGDALTEWSMVFVDTHEEAFEIKAGRLGLEVRAMQFPKDDD